MVRESSDIDLEIPPADWNETVLKYFPVHLHPLLAWATDWVLGMTYKEFAIACRACIYTTNYKFFLEPSKTKA